MILLILSDGHGALYLTESVSLSGCFVDWSLEKYDDFNSTIYQPIEQKKFMERLKILSQQAEAEQHEFLPANFRFKITHIFNQPNCLWFLVP